MSLIYVSSCPPSEKMKDERNSVNTDSSTTLVLAATIDQQDPADANAALVKKDDQSTYDVTRAATFCLPAPVPILPDRP